MFLMGGESANGARLGIIADIWQQPLGLLCGSWLSSINVLKKRRHLETRCPAIDHHWQMKVHVDGLLSEHCERFIREKKGFAAGSEKTLNRNSSSGMIQSSVFATSPLVGPSLNTM